MTLWRKAAWTASSLVFVVGVLAAQQFGPKDGADLRPDDVHRVAIGVAAPDFTLENVDGRPVTLSSYRGKYVVLVFYRGHW